MQVMKVRADELRPGDIFVDFDSRVLCRVVSVIVSADGPRIDHQLATAGSNESTDIYTWWGNHMEIVEIVRP